MVKVDVTPEKALTVPPFTREEYQWALAMQKVLAKCPPRLELMTQGDSMLYVLDKEGAKGSELGDGAASTDGVVLADIFCEVTIHGVSG